MKNKEDEDIITTPLVERIKDKIINLAEVFRIGNYNQPATSSEVDRVLKQRVERTDLKQNATASVFRFEEKEGNLYGTINGDADAIERVSYWLKNNSIRNDLNGGSLSFNFPITDANLARVTSAYNDAALFAYKDGFVVDGKYQRKLRTKEEPNLPPIVSGKW